LNSKGSALVYSTYLGGSAGVDRGWAIALDEAGNACITGDTGSNDFPIRNVIQAVFGGGPTDAFVTKLNAAGSGLIYSTLLGGNLTDEGRGIACKGSDVFVTGATSSGNFPTSNPLQVNNGGGLQNHDDAFVVRISDIVPVPTPTATPTATPTPTPVATPTPTPTPVLDTIRIQRAEYQRSKASLRVDATGTEPAATLRVYVTSTGALVGTLKNSGNGRFSASLSWPTYPQNISVRSSFGGSASSAVTLK
jgi:hypothetical protein